jgi:hypothetical protein
LSSPTSQRFNQSFVKVLAKPAQEKNFKIFLPLFKEKIKKRQRTTDSDKKGINESIDKFNMKVQFDINLRTDKNRQCITACKQYCLDAGATQGNIAYTQTASNN